MQRLLESGTVGPVLPDAKGRVTLSAAMIR